MIQKRAPALNIAVSAALLILDQSKLARGGFSSLDLSKRSNAFGKWASGYTEPEREKMLSFARGVLNRGKTGARSEMEALLANARELLKEKTTADELRELHLEVVK